MPRPLFAVDLSLNFTPHPNTGDVGVVVDADAVKRAVRNLIMLKKNEKPFHPEIACGLVDLLFENPTPVVLATIKSDIIDFINKYEPRAQRIDADVVRLTTGDIIVSISFTVQNQRVSISTPIQVQRTR